MLGRMSMQNRTTHLLRMQRNFAYGWHLDDLDDALSTSHQLTEEDKEVSEQSDVDFTGRFVEHTGEVTNMIAQPTPLPTTAIERVADRAASVKSTNPNRLRTIIRSAIHDNNTTTTPAYVVDRDVLQPSMKKLYTGGQDRIDIFLRFMTDQVEVCPHDNIKCLTDWGTPTNAEFSKQLNAQSFGQASVKKCKSWTKTSRILFTAFAQIVWPKKWKLVKTKRRCLFGIRFKEDFGGSPSNTVQTSCPTAVRPRRISLDSLSSQSTSNTNTPLPRPPGSTNSRRRDKFTPYYDILENNHCYVIRVVLPLMDEKDAKGITFNCNLAKKSLHISGSYIPGCNIGDEAHKQFRIQTPLLSTFHFPIHWPDGSIFTSNFQPM